MKNLTNFHKTVETQVYCVLSNYLGMMRTALFHCPINAEIRAADSQSIVLL